MPLSNQSIIDQLHKRRSTIVAHIKELTNQLKATENAIIGFGGSLNSKEQLGEYPEKGTYEDKIKYAIQSMAEDGVVDVTAADIAQFIEVSERMEFEDDINKMNSTVTMIASSMYKAGKIKAKKDGVRNLYYL